MLEGILPVLFQRETVDASHCNSLAVDRTPPNEATTKAAGERV